MKKRFFLLAALLILSLILTGCGSKPSTETPPNDAAKTKGETITVTDADPEGGADAYANAGDNPQSHYYVNPDFYHLKSGANLTLLPEFKTMQQTTEWSCGNACALMVLQHFGKTDVTEYGLAEAMGANTDRDTPGAKPGSADNFGEYGTNVKQLAEYFSSLPGFRVVETSYRSTYAETDLLKVGGDISPADAGNLPPTFFPAALYASENTADTDKYVDDAKDSYFVKWLVAHLKANRPVMVEWGDWDGHWQVMIGYDTNGTPGIGDDILIFADPYDTSDHWQDGYYYYPLERWFYMWKDRGVSPKPYQLQPFIVVDKAA